MNCLLYQKIFNSDILMNDILCTSNIEQIFVNRINMSYRVAQILWLMIYRLHKISLNSKCKSINKIVYCTSSCQFFNSCHTHNLFLFKRVTSAFSQFKCYQNITCLYYIAYRRIQFFLINSASAANVGLHRRWQSFYHVSIFWRL